MWAEPLVQYWEVLRCSVKWKLTLGIDLHTCIRVPGKTHIISCVPSVQLPSPNYLKSAENNTLIYSTEESCI